MVRSMMLLGTRKGLLQFEYEGNSWRFARQSFDGIPIPYAVVDERTGTLWASNDHGHWGQKLHRSHDLGKTWEEVPAPKYPDYAKMKKDAPAVLDFIWYIVPGGAEQPERLYLGTNPGGLFRSEDGGDSFELVRSLWDHPSRLDHWFGGGRDTPGICSMMVDPRDSAHLVVGISCGGVFESRDDGTTWSGINKGLNAAFLPDPNSEYGHDPHFMTFCRTQPDHLWQQNHCGIFRSTDCGQQWQEVSEKDGPARFGWAICVDPDDPETAWVVPASDDEKRLAIHGALTVCRTSDGGKSWQALNHGLPQQHCYDIVYRHAFDLDGDALAFGTTTGNLFYSADRGESWSCLGHHFPPIYSVRFCRF